MDKTLSFTRRIPIRHEVDVFVAGGGPAGCAAALAAAYAGRKVFLAEGQNCLGGMGTAGMIPVFMTFSDGVNFLAAGIGEKIHRRLCDAGGTGPDSKLCIRAEVLKRVYDDLLLEAGVDFTFHTQFIGVETDCERVTLAVLAAKSGLFAVKAKMFVDGTGDGDLAAWAGAPFEKGDADGGMMPG
ncbi:MAG: FAD-dependent oxidoreductase, partial [Planctomycetes bacterium]|nr:FAD-dependent oxidoreductase [Planctomycetota bacterium]